MKTRQLEFDNIRQLRKYLDTKASNKNTISLKNAQSLLKKESLRTALSNEVNYSGRVSTRDSAIIFSAVYNQEHLLFIAILKYYIAEMGPSCLLTIKDKYGFNLVHKIAYSGKKELFRDVLEIYKENQQIIQLGLFTESRKNASLIERITPVDLLIMYKHNDFITEMIQKGIMSENTYYNYLSGAFTPSEIMNRYISDERCSNQNSKINSFSHIQNIAEHFEKNINSEAQQESRNNIAQCITDFLNKSDNVLESSGVNIYLSTLRKLLSNSENKSLKWVTANLDQLTFLLLNQNKSKAIKQLRSKVLKIYSKTHFNSEVNKAGLLKYIKENTTIPSLKDSLEPNRLLEIIESSHLYKLIKRFPPMLREQSISEKQFEIDISMWINKINAYCGICTTEYAISMIKRLTRNNEPVFHLYKNEDISRSIVDQCNAIFRQKRNRRKTYSYISLFLITRLCDTLSLSVDRRGAHFGLLSELHDTLFVEDNDVDSLSFSNVMFTGQNDLNRLLRHEKPDKKDTQSYCKNQKNIREVLSYFTDLFISEIRAQATPYRSLPSLCVNAAIYIYESFTSVLTESYKKTQNKMLIDSVLQALCDGNKNLNNLMIKIRNLDEATVITTNINRENITSICRIILLSTLIDIADISNTETSLLKENDKFIALTQAEEKLKKSILHNNDLERLRNIIDKKEREFDAFKNLSIVKNFSYNETKKNSTDTIIGWCRTDETLSQSNYFRKKSKKRRKEDLKETQKTKSNKSKKKKTKGQSSIPNSRSIVCESHTKKNQSTQTSTSTNLAPQAPPYVYSIRLFNDNLRIEETTTPVFKITTKKAVRRPKISTVINSNTGVRTITFDFTDENNTTLNHTLCL